MTTKWLYVGGIIGEEADVVSPSLETAIDRTEDLVSRYRTPSQQQAWEEGEDRDGDVKWECVLVDGYFLRLTTTMTVEARIFPLYVVALRSVEGLRTDVEGT